MEISVNCGFADVFVLDSAGYEVITFEDVKVKGATGDCGGNWDGGVIYEPGLILED